MIHCLLTLLLWIGPELEAKDARLRPRPCPHTDVTIQQAPRRLIITFDQQAYICRLEDLRGVGWGQFAYFLSHDRAWYQGQVRIPCEQTWGS